MNHAIVCQPHCQQQSSVKVALLSDTDNLMPLYAEQAGTHEWGQMLGTMAKDPFWRVRVCVAKHAARLSDEELAITIFIKLFEKTNEQCVNVRTSAALEFVSHRPDMCSKYVLDKWSDSSGWTDASSIGYETRMDRVTLAAALLACNYASEGLEGCLIKEIRDPTENVALHAVTGLMDVLRDRSAPLKLPKSEYTAALKYTQGRGDSDYDPFLENRYEANVDPHQDLPYCLSATASDVMQTCNASSCFS